MRLFFLFLAIAGNFKLVDAVECFVGTLIDKQGSIYLHEWTVNKDFPKCKVEFHDDCSITLNFESGARIGERHHRSCITDGCNADVEKYIGEARNTNNGPLNNRCRDNYNKAITLSRPHLSKLRPIYCTDHENQYPLKNENAPDVKYQAICAISFTNDCKVSHKYVKPDSLDDVGKCKKTDAGVVCHCSHENHCNTHFKDWINLAKPFMKSDYIERCQIPFKSDTEPGSFNNPNEGQAPVNNNQQYYQYYQEGSISVAVTTTLVSVVLLVVT